MKTFSKIPMLAAVLLLMTTAKLQAQDLSAPGAYFSFFNDKLRTVNQTYMNYLSAVSHGKSARKVEKLREKTVNTIFNARMEASGTPPYKGDKALRDATVAYLKTCYAVFNEDYSKIVNMEEIAEQSYDAMEAYLLAQQKPAKSYRKPERSVTNRQKFLPEKTTLH